MDDIEKYLATATLLPFEDVIGLVLKEHKLLTTVELFPTFGIINRNMPYGDMKLREGYSNESDDLIETSAASLVITANNLVAYPVESTRVCAHIVYNVSLNQIQSDIQAIEIGNKTIKFYMNESELE